MGKYKPRITDILQEQETLPIEEKMEFMLFPLDAKELNLTCNLFFLIFAFNFHQHDSIISFQRFFMPGE